MLGADWDKTYAASNTIYVARQNNILFSVLAQYFRTGGHQRSADPDRDHLVHHDAGRHAGFADPHHRRPVRRRGVLRQFTI